jgi:hypothetical protein
VLTVQIPAWMLNSFMMGLRVCTGLIRAAGSERAFMDALSAIADSLKDGADQSQLPEQEEQAR